MSKRKKYSRILNLMAMMVLLVLASCLQNKGPGKTVANANSSPKNPYALDISDEGLNKSLVATRNLQLPNEVLSLFRLDMGIATPDYFFAVEGVAKYKAIVNLLVIEEQSGAISHVYKISFGSFLYSQLKQKIRDITPFPGSWVGCGYFGDITGEGQREFALFEMGGVAQFFRVIRFDAGTGMQEELLSVKISQIEPVPVRYGSHDGTNGFIVFPGATEGGQSGAAAPHFYSFDSSKSSYIDRGVVSVTN